MTSQAAAVKVLRWMSLLAILLGSLGDLPLELKNAIKIIGGLMLCHFEDNVGGCWRPCWGPVEIRWGPSGGSEPKSLGVQKLAFRSRGSPISRNPPGIGEGVWGRGRADVPLPVLAREREARLL